MNNHAKTEAIKQLQSKAENLENNQPQKKHGHKLMHPANSQLKRALRATMSNILDGIVENNRDQDPAVPVPQKEFSAV